MAENIFFGAKKSFLQSSDSMSWYDLHASNCPHKRRSAGHHRKSLCKSAFWKSMFHRFPDSKTSEAFCEKHLSPFFQPSNQHHKATEASEDRMKKNPSQIPWVIQGWVPTCGFRELPNHGNWIAHLLDVCERKSHVSFLARNICFWDILLLKSNSLVVIKKMLGEHVGLHHF